VLGLSRDADAARQRLDQLAANLQMLETGGAATGFQVPALPAELRPQLAEMKRHATTLQGLARDWFAGSDAVTQREATLASLQELSDHAFLAADGLTGALSAMVEARHRDIRQVLLVLGAALACLLAAAMFALRRRVVRPLQVLARATQAFASGHREERVAVRAGDEVGELSESFNRMADAIAQQMGELESTHLDLRKLSSAIEYSPASVIITDAEGRIEYVNPRFTLFTGYASDEVIGRKTSMLQSGKTERAVYQGLWRTISSGGAWRGRLLNRRKSGDVYWEDTWIAPIRNDAGCITHYVAVKEDVTERVRFDEERARLQEELERRVESRTRELSATVRELETFSYSVSHDLRSPLRAIQSYAKLMEPTCSDCTEDDAYTYLTRIQAASTRMGEIIDDLLDLARISRSELKLAEVDLSAMAKAIIGEFAQAAPERGLAAFVEEGVTVTADPGMLRLALENLLGNAWKFTAGRTPARLTVTAQRRNGETVVGIADNGVGFDMSYADKLFHPFERLHGTEEFEGTGIGLATVSRIVHLHGGHVWAEGQLDQGASFFFSLPDHPAGVTPENPAP
ncbi:MAG: PAS domain S-box protein, partial [Burkholderiales bacterium]